MPKLKSLKRYKAKGFTLVELLVSMTLITILAGYAAPKMIKYSRARSLSAGIQSIHNALLLARQHAIETKQDVSVTFTEGEGSSGTFSVFTDNGNGVHNASEGDRLLRSGAMPENVNIYNIDLNGSLNSGNSILFNPMGFPTKIVAGAPVFFDGNIDIKSIVDQNTTTYKRVAVSTGGSLSIEKSSNGSVFFK